MTEKPRLHFDSEGLRVESYGKLSELLRWIDVLEVFAFKEDVFGYDIICLGFLKNDNNTYWKVDEECEGYRELLHHLPHVFPGYPGRLVFGGSISCVPTLCDFVMGRI